MRNPLDFGGEDEKKKQQRANLDLSRFTIGWDKWDRQTVQRLLKEVRQFDAQREKLVDQQAGPVGYDVWQDLFLSLNKVLPNLMDPEEVRPTHLVNRMVMDEAMKLTEHRELRMWTHADEIGSALACITMEPDMEILYDRLKEAQKAANALQEAMEERQRAEDELRDAEQMYAEWTQDNDPQDEENGDQASDIEEMLAQMAAAVDEAGDAEGAASQALQAELGKAQGAAAGQMQAGMEKAIDEAKDMAAASNMFGTEPGSLRKLPAEKRLQLAAKMNTDKFRRVAQLFGPMERMAFDQQKRKVDYLREEIYDLEMGNDLTRVLSERLVQMADDEEEDFFWADYAEGKLPQYKMRGQERVAKGGIIYIHDGSGSMGGDREVWAKAVGLCLLHLAKKSKPVRQFVAIQFGAAGQTRIDDFREPGLDPDTVLDFAEFFYSGGTNFESPLKVGLTLLQEEHDKTGAIKSDIVFATDGFAPISDSFMTAFKEEQAKLDFRVWGINIAESGGRDETRKEPLNTLCDGMVCSIKDLTTGGDVKDIFGGI